MKFSRYDTASIILFIEFIAILITGINFDFLSMVFGGLIFVFGLMLGVYWEFFWNRNSLGMKIITKGIYSKIRHPMFSSIIAGFFGLSIFFSNLIGLVIALLGSVYIHYASLKEEKELRMRFGEKYEEYMKKTKKRFIPGVF